MFLFIFSTIFASMARIRIANISWLTLACRLTSCVTFVTLCVINMVFKKSAFIKLTEYFVRVE